MTAARFTAVSRRRVVVICTLLFSVGAVAVGVRAQAPVSAPPLEQLEAALLMTFVNYTTWPSDVFPSPSAPLVVGVIGNEAVEQALEVIARDRKVNRRSVAPKRLRWDSDLTGVHVLFLGQVEPRHVALLLAQIQRRPILTVSMLSEFSREGGIIGLKFSGGRVSFAVNSRATELSGLRLSSFLLSHATKVSNE